MTKIKHRDNTDILLETIIEGVLEKKGENIKNLDLSEIHHAICDNFIICDAQSNTQVSSIADFLEDTVKEKTGFRCHHKEGMDNSFWVLLDFGDIIVHIFQKEYRDFYNLEGLWADAKITSIKES